MSTLLLRFAGPMQAWGVDSRFEIRKTNREPTKSGATGLLAAALGLRRDAPLGKLTALRFGVRVDREGRLLRDFHMVHQQGGKQAVFVTERYYLCDAVFLVGFYGEDEAWMRQLEAAVSHPAFPLFLGRRSCPPEGRVCLGLREMDLEQALRQEPYLAVRDWGRNKTPGQARLLLEDPMGSAYLAYVPVSYSPEKRQYAYRAAREAWLAWTGEEEHDPMQELR